MEGSRLVFRVGVGFGETDLRSGGLLPEGVSDAGLHSAAEGLRVLGVEIQPFSSTVGQPRCTWNAKVVERMGKAYYYRHREDLGVFHRFP